MKLYKIILCILLIVTALNGCTKQQDPTPEIKADLRGFSLSPKSFQPEDFNAFFEKAGNMVSWAGDGNELATEKSGPVVVASLAATKGYTSVIEAQFFTQEDGKLLRPLDTETYKKNIVNFVKKYNPKYLALGIEVNILQEKSPTDFDEFTRFYNEIYKAVKETSPNTKVFTIFQLEKIKGLQGGLMGGTQPAQWSLLDKFPNSDIIAFTTYPGLIYKDPKDIPQDYYTEIKAHTTKQIAFTEIGWHSATSPQEWESSEEEQKEFIETFFQQTENIDKEFMIWSFLYDQETKEPFDSMGLMTKEGREKQAYETWKNYLNNQK